MKDANNDNSLDLANSDEFSDLASTLPAVGSGFQLPLLNPTPGQPGGVMGLDALLEPLSQLLGDDGELYIEPAASNTSGEVFIKSRDESDPDAAAAPVTLRGGDNTGGDGNGEGGAVRLYTGSSTGQAGSAYIFGGTGMGLGGVGGGVYFYGGDASTGIKGGEVSMRGGQAENHLGAHIQAMGGESNSNYGGSALISGGNGFGGGDVQIEGGLNSDAYSYGGNIQIKGGDSPGGAGGRVDIIGGSNQVYAYLSSLGGPVAIKSGADSYGTYSTFELTAPAYGTARRTIHMNTDDVEIECHKLGVFYTTPVAQQVLAATPTVTEISTVLRNYGLTKL